MDAKIPATSRLRIPTTSNSLDARQLNLTIADHAGMFWTFSNGNTWLRLNDKRLFLVPHEEVDNWDRGHEAEEEWPIMGPAELREVLEVGNIPLLRNLTRTGRRCSHGSMQTRNSGNICRQSSTQIQKSLPNETSRVNVAA